MNKKQIGALLAIYLVIYIYWLPSENTSSPMDGDPSHAYVKPENIDKEFSDILQELDLILKTKAPKVYNSLLPGLTKADIEEVEQEFDIKLSADIKTLYMWKNGQSPTSEPFLIPGQIFTPLKDIFIANKELEKDVKKANFAQRTAYNILAGHRRGWLTVLDDGAGDGYFYDLSSSKNHYPVFHYFAETGTYTCFPSLKYLFYVIAEGYKQEYINSNGDSDSDAQWTSLYDLMYKYSIIQDNTNNI